MDRVKGLKVGVMLAAFWAASWGTLAGDALRVESLQVPHDAAWRRGPASQEQEDGVYLLDLPAGQASAAQVALMRRAPIVKGDAEDYYDRLTRYWRASYGKAVLIDWVEAGGVKWRSLRRPSNENAMGVFQLSTVSGGRAYSLLVFVPGTVSALPGAVMELLAGMRFWTGPPASQMAEAAPAPLPVPAESWARTRTYRFSLSAAALDAALAADVDHLGQDGMLTGYGLEYGEASVDWFMEGFAWKAVAGREVRVPWATRGRLEVEAPAKLGAGAVWTLRLILPEGEAAVSARLAMWDLCGPPGVLKDVLDSLNRGVRNPMERLAAATPAACPSTKTAIPALRLKGEAGKTVTATWSPPGSPDRVEPVEIAGYARVRLAEAVLEPGGDRTLPGDGLLQRARLFFSYEPR